MLMNRPTKEEIKEHQKIIGSYNLMKAYIPRVVKECKGRKIDVNNILHITIDGSGTLTVQYYYTEDNEDFSAYIHFPITWLYMSDEELEEVIVTTGKRDKWQ